MLNYHLAFDGLRVHLFNRRARKVIFEKYLFSKG